MIEFSRFSTIFFLALFVLASCSEQKEDDLRNTFDSNSPTGLTADESFGGNAYGGGESYNGIEENPFISTSDEPVSTFSIDADGASYSNARRFLENGQLPPKDAIRTEELVNFFQYDYDSPTDGTPIAVETEISTCPWNEDNRLFRVGIKGVDIPWAAMPHANFVFLIDVSGSMTSPEKLELLKRGFEIFTENLRSQDRVAIVTYAGEAGVLLESTAGNQKQAILNAIDQLGAGGSTNGAGGILKAYEIAEANFISGGNNRVILGTDGDFNVGMSSQDELVELIEEKRESGVFLSVLGVGTGNLQDGMMEQLANNGNGNYEYIDDLEQAEKVFDDEIGKFLTVAKDVKIQIEFNPTMVYEYRLIGYENRLLENEEFEDDTKDAGEIGAGQAITALYELKTPLGASFFIPALKLDMRYKLPDSDNSIPLNVEVVDEDKPFAIASENHRFAASAAAYGLLLRDSEYKGTATWDDLLEWASNAQSFDPNGYRNEFLQWVEKAKELQ